MKKLLISLLALFSFLALADSSLEEKIHDLKRKIAIHQEQFGSESIDRKVENEYDHMLREKLEKMVLEDKNIEAARQFIENYIAHRTRLVTNERSARISQEGMVPNFSELFLLANLELRSLEAIQTRNFETRFPLYDQKELEEVISLANRLLTLKLFKNIEVKLVSRHQKILEDAIARKLVEVARDDQNNPLRYKLK